MSNVGRPRKRPEFDPDNVMKELMDVVSAIYAETGELKKTSEEIGLSALKVRKILITAGVFENETAAEVAELFREGKSAAEIQKITGLGRSSVNGYLPYVKAPYNAKEISLNAERIRVYRERQASVKKLYGSFQAEWTGVDDPGAAEAEKALWDTIVLFQNYRFLTMSGLPFSYQLKVGRNGQFNRELLISRRKGSKSLAWSSLKLAFYKAKKLQGHSVKRPKDIGDIRGISYIYAMFLRWGIIVGE